MAEPLRRKWLVIYELDDGGGGAFTIDSPSFETAREVGAHRLRLDHQGRAAIQDVTGWDLGDRLTVSKSPIVEELRAAKAEAFARLVGVEPEDFQVLDARPAPTETRKETER